MSKAAVERSSLVAVGHRKMTRSKTDLPRKSYYFAEIRKINTSKANRYRKAFIYIGSQIDRWKKAMELWEIPRNSDFAKFLLDRLDIEKTKLLEQQEEQSAHQSQQLKNNITDQGLVKEEMEDGCAFTANVENQYVSQDGPGTQLKIDNMDVYDPGESAESLCQAGLTSGDCLHPVTQSPISYDNIQHEHIDVEQQNIIKKMIQQTNSLPVPSLFIKQIGRKKDTMNIPSPLSQLNWKSNYSRMGKKKTIYKCHQCGKRYKDKTCFLKHERRHAAGEMTFIPCDHCDKKFKSQESYQRHQRSLPGVKPYQCHFCEEKFQRKKDCYNHEISQHGPKPYKCSICPMAFGCNSALIVHVRYHTGERPYACQYCGKRFYNRCHRRDHELIHKFEENPDCAIFPCQSCGKVFRRKRNLKTHEKIHAAVKPYQCQYCEKSFICKTNLTSHEKLHVGEKTCKCQYCEKAYVDIHSLRRHEKLHLRERSFQCQFCSKMFLAKKDVDRHEMIHTGEKPFQCQYCEKVFSQKGNCISHERTHTGEKPYKCQYCYQAFTHNVSLLSHIKSHHRKVI
ncbi:zinc finger protein 883 isoform X2 [Lingula anatina]|uniref:Zinc finger protein 883 isoform X2 n=1 Tax=Lingula anatina TaxID=7574 RepID=A0A1S3KFJ0_LINAN|nr:zinc finger protein 883 isoform X2 [Lingula anatina]|eukprot:XP_013421001.1 zinc finger protein 883 isoform X2 [Lingula anatina]